ncbi:MAG: SusC/RagA family TonB-linked outer membrane protein [Prevotella sp.]|nr:SusC/RagA family TonB-linked outer membrane protein [Prevotella sp.]MBR0527381.1 SusC/RagA family TonB-linked outer membrane protein [Prevotella sp.]MBR3011060.1 SusC/RagA family TonB-linked outer membrane protein [Prevotella sp.]
MKRRLTMILTFMLLSVGVAMAQTKVSGTVVEAENDEPIIGAVIKLKGQKSALAVTDIDGNFSFTTSQKNPSLEVSSIGFVTQTIKAGQNLVIKMVSDSRSIDEVVVTGMQKMDKRLFTGATAKVDAEKTKLDGVADVSRALEGRAAGVSVQNVSGTFGTAPKIRVRGATSIYGSSKPLWVIDGVIQEDAVEVSADDLSSGDAKTLISNAISGLSADDIESFQVLKDGSATSIYGARAMAGVVVVTTKRGKAGRSTINYTGEFTYRLKPSYRNYNISNSQEQMGIYKEMAAKGWLEFSALANGSTAGLYGKMYNLIAQYDETNGKYGLPYTDAAMNAYLQQAEFRNTDWFDLLFRDNIMQNHSVSISTGSDKANLYASISAISDPGWTMDSKVERYTANVNATFNLSKQLSVSLLTNNSWRKQKAPGTLNQSTDVVSGSVNRSFDINPYSYAMNTSRTLDPDQIYTRNYAPFNIFDELNNNYIDLGISDMKYQGEVTWKPIMGLEFHAMGAYRTVNSTQKHIILNQSNMAEAYRAGVDDPNKMYSNPYLYQDPDKPNSLPVSVMPVGGISIRDDNTMEQLQFRGTVQYNKIWNDTHIMNLFGGMEANKVNREAEYHATYGVDYESSRNVLLTPEFTKQAKEEGTTLESFSKTWTRNLAYFMSGSYSYKGRYTINLTGRYEGSNGLGKSRSSRWLPTWNVSGAWNAHEEAWMQRWMEKTNYVLSHAALRLSYSLTADRVPSFVSNARPIFYSDIAWRPQGEQQEQMTYLYQIANSELTYEKKKEFNVGVDLGFLHNRINLTLDAYWRDNYDLIGIIKTQGVGGMISKYANVATMKSSGFEATLSTRNIQTQNFNWTTDLTFSLATNEITDLESRSNVIDLITGNSSSHFRVGYPRSALFSIPFVGLNDEGIPQFINQNGDKVTSDIYFQEYEKLDFLKYEGPTEPTITGGLNNMFTWKNWRLNVFITYSFGNKVRLDPAFSAGYSDMSAMPKEFKNRWVQPGDEKITDIPAIASVRQYYNDSQLGYAYNAYNYSTARVADGGFIRMKDISLTYDMPQRWIHKIGLNTCSLKLDATNLFLIYADDKLNGQDPEFVNSGGVASPMPKQFTFTLRLGI